MYRLQNPYFSPIVELPIEDDLSSSKSLLSLTIHEGSSFFILHALNPACTQTNLPLVYQIAVVLKYHFSTFQFVSFK